MHLNFKKRICAFWLAVISLFCLLAAAGAEEEQYLENDMNFVDGSVDVSNGIPDNAEGVLRKIRERGVLRVATEPYFPPQEFLDEKKEGQEQFAGADMELARMIAERMGVSLEIVPMEFTRVLEAVAEDECDLAISALAFMPSRATTNELSKGYYYSGASAGSGLIIRSESVEVIRTIDDLADKTIIAQSGSIQESLMAENVIYYQEFRRVSSASDCYDAVRKGLADAACVDYETAEDYIREHPEENLMLVEGVAFKMRKEYEGDRIAGKKGELQLMYFVNGVIDEMNEKDLYHQWLEAAQARMDELEME
ncbi:MAG: amino acid ABC transporter substrate-binding protein [Clostridia bacterium]|nr:amino acid ABC transporter substrate-binding protein [Clostridia bacterium]